MKKILSLLAILSLANCASDLTAPRDPKIKGKIDKSALLYIDKKMDRSYVVTSEAESFEFNISKISSSNSTGTESKKSVTGYNVGEMSAKQFKSALSQAFSSIDITNVNPGKDLGKHSYLIVPTITHMDVKIRKVFLRSYIDITYKIDVYDKSGQLVYSGEKKISQGGKIVKTLGSGGFSLLSMSAGAKIDTNQNEGPMFYKAISNGVDDVINDLIKSEKL